MTEKAEKTPVMCVSLDNCIVGGDSLHKLASFLKGYGLRHGKLGLVRRIYSLSHSRRNFDISQRRFKFELSRTLRAIKDKTLAEKFARKLLLSLNPKVIGLMEEYRKKGGKVAVVTSAPAEYAEPLCALVEADICIATPSLTEFRMRYPHDPIDYEECAGTEKIVRLQEWADSNGLVLRTVVSGEPDELPLLLLPDVESRYLVSPTNHMRRHLRRHNVFYETL